MTDKSPLKHIKAKNIAYYYNNNDKKAFPRIIKLFYDFDTDKNGSLTIEEAYDGLVKGFKLTSAKFKENLKNILTKIAGDDKKIDIYEWILLNYLFDKGKNPSKKNSIDYNKFQEIKNSLETSNDKYKYIQNREILEYNNHSQGHSIYEIYNNLYKNNTKTQRTQSPQKTQQQTQQSQQTKSLKKIKISQQTQQIQQTKLPQQIQKKIELVKIFNKNLTNFKEDYNSIKDLIKINTFSFNPFINVPLGKDSKKINEKFNEIIQKNNNNNNNCKKIINTIKPDLKGDNPNNPNTINIKIFILLCYYINQLNCILNKFNDELKQEYKSGSRFNNNTINIKYLKIELQKIINNSNDEIDIEQICTNVNIILDIILEIFRGIHSDLSNFNNQPEYNFLDADKIYKIKSN